MTAARHSESERRTRQERIDPRLRAWGWEIMPFEDGRPLSAYRHHAIEEYPTANGPTDCALVVADWQMTRKSRRVRFRHCHGRGAGCIVIGIVG